MPPRMKFLLSLVGFTIILRLLPYALTTYDVKLDSTTIFYPWNFSPLMAVGLYSGAFIADRRWKFGLPLLTLFVSDLGIWAVTGQFSWAFQSDRWSAYLCYFATVVMGQGLNRQAWPTRAFAALGRGILAETLFFIVTNFVYFWIQTEYPHSLAGLIACYVAAIPFAGRSFVSTAFYSVLLFSPLAVGAAGKSTKPEFSLQPIRSL